MRHTALQIDPPHRLNPASDTSVMLGLEAQNRGYQVWWHPPAALTWEGGEVRASLQRVSFHNEASDWFTLGEHKILPLSEMQIVWMRQDPPFNMEYITATHLLEHAGTRVVNDPVSVRNAPEKLSALHFSEYMPPTLITSNEEEIQQFADTHGALVAKPLHGYGGRAIFKFIPDDHNRETFLEFWRERSPEPLIWQAFLPEVATGDRRLILINGELKACFGRLPSGGSIRANMRVGGTPVAAEPTPRQLEIAGHIGAMARAQGLLIVGLDVIGDYLTEINVTSPTGFRAAQALYGIDLAKAAWDAVE
jgi:glutathione synthase